MTRFSWITEPTEAGRPDFDLPVCQSRHFVVLPTLGALVEDWLLIVPRRKMSNLTFLTHTERKELSAIVGAFTQRLGSKQREVFSFEHGAHFDSVLGCGVDQAHLHLVPLPFNLYEVATAMPDIVWEKFNTNSCNLNDLSRGREYLWVANSTNQAAIGFPLHATSQWFRKLIAAEIGYAEAWDYKTNPNFETLKRTAMRLAPAHD